MFIVTLFICGVLTVTSSHRIYHDHFEENGHQVNFGFPFSSEINHYGSQTGLQRRHIQDSSSINMHATVHGRGTHPQFGSGESRIPDYYSYHTDISVTDFHNHGLPTNERDNNIVTTNIFNFFTPKIKRIHPHTDESYRRSYGRNFEQDKVFQVTEGPINNIDVVSRSLNANFDAQEVVEDEKQGENASTPAPIETTVNNDQSAVVTSQNIEPESTTTQENIHQIYSTPLPYTSTKVTKTNDVSGDRWIWDDSGDEMKKTSSSTSPEPELDNRDAFKASCPTGFTRVVGQCVKED